jgi:hypothetical protein
LSRIDQRDVTLLVTEIRALLMERARRGTGRRLALGFAR